MLSDVADAIAALILLTLVIIVVSTYAMYLQYMVQYTPSIREVAEQHARALITIELLSRNVTTLLYTYCVETPIAEVVLVPILLTIGNETYEITPLP